MAQEKKERSSALISKIANHSRSYNSITFMDYNISAYREGLELAKKAFKTNQNNIFLLGKPLDSLLSEEEDAYFLSNNKVYLNTSGKDLSDRRVLPLLKNHSTSSIYEAPLEVSIPSSSFSSVLFLPDFSSRFFQNANSMMDSYKDQYQTLLSSEGFSLESAINQEAQDLENSISRVKHSLSLGLIDPDNIPKHLLDGMKDVRGAARKKILKEKEEEIKLSRQFIKRELKDLSFMRQESSTLTVAFRTLKKNGLFASIYPKHLLIGTPARHMARVLTDLKIVDLTPSDPFGLVFIIGRKDETRIVDNDRYRSDTISYFGEIANLDRFDYNHHLSVIKAEDESYLNENKELLDLGSEIKKRELSIDYKEALISSNLFYTVERFIKEEFQYSVPDTRSLDILNFKIGAYSAEDIRKRSRSHILSNNLLKSVNSMKQRNEAITPAPLHEGHIAMLLTSGLLNSYISTGINRHLVKSKTIKTKNLISSSEEEKGIVNNRYLEGYSVSLSLLDSSGIFRNI